MKRGVTIPDQPRAKYDTDYRTPPAQIKVLRIDDAEDETQRVSTAPESADEFIVASDDKAEYNKGLYRFALELGPSVHTNPESAYKISALYISGDGTEQLEGDDIYQRIAHDMVLDFAADDNVLVIHSDTLTGALSLRNNLLAPARTPPEVITIFGYSRNVPVNDLTIFRNILRTAICKNVFYNFKILPTDLPVESRAVPFPYRAIAFMVPAVVSNMLTSDHFAALIYFTHDHDSRPPYLARDRHDITGRFSGHRKSRDAPVRLYFYDSLNGRNLANAKLVAKLLSDIHFFNDSGACDVIPVFQSAGYPETFQVMRECSSFSLFFAERAREAILRGSFRALLREDYAFRDTGSCAVSLLRQTKERILTEASWWERTAARAGSSRTLVEVAESFVRRRVEFTDGNTSQRADSLVASLVSMLTHGLNSQGRSQKIVFATEDPEDKVNLNPDLLRLYLLTSLVLPNNVLFSTSISHLGQMWEESIATYRMMVDQVRTGASNVRDLSAILPRLVVWLSLPEEDSSQQPVGLRSPTVVIGRPHYTLGTPQAAARLCHINVYTKTQAGLSPEEHCIAVNNDLLSDVFYENMKNYAEDPSKAYEPDNARFVSWYSSWRYGVIDVIRNIAKQDGYFDYYEMDASGEYVASWARTYTADTKAIRADVVQAERKRVDHRDARMHLRGKMLQLLSTEDMHENSTNRTSMLFNTRGISRRVNIDTEVWHYSDVRPRVVGGEVYQEDSIASVLRRQWAFCYYNLTFGAAVSSCVKQQLGENGWGVTSVPCALELPGTGVIAMLETWSIVTTPEWVSNPGPTVPMPIMLCGARVGLESSQPCYFGILDIVRLFSSTLWRDEWRSFFDAHNKGSFVEYPVLMHSFGILGGPFTGSQDPYTRLLLKDFDYEMATRIDSVVSALKQEVRSIDPRTYSDTIAVAQSEAASQVIMIAAAFIVSKARL